MKNIELRCGGDIIVLGVNYIMRVKRMSTLILKSQRTKVKPQISAMEQILENQIKKAQAMSLVMFNQTKNDVSINLKNINCL